jgi:hypothetical protein
MTTDELIAALARSPEPAHPRRFNARIALALVAGLALGLLLLKLTLGFRPDIGIAAPVVALKAGLSAMIATFAGGLAVKLAKPQLAGNGQAKSAASPLIALIIGSVVAGIITLLATSPGQRFAAFMGGGFPWCIVLIPLLGLPTAVLLMWVLKDAAPTRLMLAGASVGALSGGIGAVVYAMFCPIDSIAFVTIWYVAGIGLASAMGAWVGATVLRW